MKLKSRMASLHVSAWYLTRQSGIEMITNAPTTSKKLGHHQSSAVSLTALLVGMRTCGNVGEQAR